MRPPSPRLLVAACVALSLALGCASTPKPTGKPRRTVLMTTYDDARVGRETSEDVKAEIGVIDDPAIAGYVDGIGHKLLRGVPLHGFDFHFYVVDMLEPNAFTLPGGYIFISRGLLALANNEDELACVIGHEITHAVRRHAAAQQALQSHLPPLFLPASAAKFASYSREMEHEADQGGQILCAAAGYDPMGMSTFLTSLSMSARLLQGYTRAPGFFDTHPGSEERAAANAVRAREIRWTRDPSLGNPRTALLAHTDGLEVGQRPQAGVFQGDRFLHPALGFTLRFPPGWDKRNTNRAVGASQPRGEAGVFLTSEAPTGEVHSAAESWVAKQQENARIEVEDSKPVKVGGIDAWRMDTKASGAGGSVRAQLTFIPFHGSTWLISGVTPSNFASRYEGILLATARSFRPLSEEERRSIQVLRLRVAVARPGERLAELVQRTGDQWSGTDTAVMNGLFADHRFEGGEQVKFSRLEPYTAP